jgi:hypothetical protein
VSSPRAVFGLPVYGETDHLAEAIESLLSQTEPSLALVVTDDGGGEAEALVRRYGADPRLSYERNERRLGLIGNWRRCLELARTLHPGADFFAWASDHDAWHPRWLEVLAAELDAHPEAVLAYPLNYRVDAHGAVLRLPWHFDTAGIAQPRQRLATAARRMWPGDMVYGLFRRAVIERTELRPVLLPDRLLLSELALAGEFRQVGETLWYRRFEQDVSAKRQRAAFHPDGVPLRAYVPWLPIHVGALARDLVVEGRGQPAVTRRAGVGAVAAYTRSAGTMLAIRRTYQWRRALRKRRVKVQRAIGVRRKTHRRSELGRLLAARAEHVVEVDQPLVLISQVQRSGGTLLGQLFDGHPACHVHPGELHIGHPRVKEDWPPIDPDAPPDIWFKLLAEKHLRQWVRQGYAGRPFLFSETVQRALFMAAVDRRRPRTRREVLDCYMTSFFNAWLDNQNLYGGPRRWVVGFAAQMAVRRANREALFADYPHGRLIGVLRDPGGWFASARAYDARTYGNLESAIALWAESARALAHAHREHPGQVHVVAFEDLVDETAPTMEALAAALDIPFDPALTEPTFNGVPVAANSSFTVAQPGLIREPSGRSRELRPEEGKEVRRLAGGLYEEVRALAIDARQGTSTPQSAARTSASSA